MARRKGIIFLKRRVAGKMRGVNLGANHGREGVDVESTV